MTTRTCPACAEAVLAAATRCPHCQEPLPAPAQGRAPAPPAPATPRASVGARLGAIGLSALLLAAACAAPALVFSKGGQEDEWLGLQALLMGWLGLFFLQPAWLANVTLAASWVLLAARGYAATIVASLLGLACAAAVLRLQGAEFPGDEGGVTKLLFVRTGPGCWLWVASLAAPIPAALALRRTERAP